MIFAMQTFTARPKTDPTGIYVQRDGMYAPELVAVAATGIDFFSWLAKAPADAATICSSLGLAARPVDVMLTLFCAMGYIEKQGEKFSLTEMSREFLVSDSPWFVGPYFAYFKDRPVYQGLLETLRTDKPGGWSGVKARKPWAESMQDDAFAQEFTGSMDARGVYVGPIMAERLDLQRHRHLLDVAGGSGIYACCVVAAHPHMKATLYDRSPVDRVAAKMIAQRGYSDRVGVAAGDMFRDPLPADCDVHLWSNAFHDWDAPVVKQLAAKSFDALPSGGMIVVHDRHLNREKTGPLRIAAHSVFLMAGTEGRYYSIGEIEEYLGAAGFRDFGYRDVVLDYSVITACKP